VLIRVTILLSGAGTILIVHGAADYDRLMAGSENFTGKVTLVTGGSRGIGRAIAAALLDRGSSVAITGRDESALARARDDLARHGAGVESIQADVRDPAAVRRAVQQTVGRFGGLDVLVNNAGVGHFANVADMTDTQWHEVIGTNLTGVFYCCRECLPHLRARGEGWIVNISSLAGANWFGGGGAYCGSKAALNAFSEALMQEVRHDNIRVSYVMPGSVDTGFAGHGGAAPWKLSPEDVARVVIDLIAHDPRSLPSRVELRPSKPPRK
jgi:NAD(P)-dependent dehydrogenase (short-subunit alcohol dehydrogenase family)